MFKRWVFGRNAARLVWWQRREDVFPLLLSGCRDTCLKRRRFAGLYYKIGRTGATKPRSGNTKYAGRHHQKRTNKNKQVSSYAFGCHGDVGKSITANSKINSFPWEMMTFPEQPYSKTHFTGVLHEPRLSGNFLNLMWAWLAPRRKSSLVFPNKWTLISLNSTFYYDFVKIRPPWKRLQ